MEHKGFAMTPDLEMQDVAISELFETDDVEDHQTYGYVANGDQYALHKPSDICPS